MDFFIGSFSVLDVWGCDFGCGVNVCFEACELVGGLEGLLSLFSMVFDEWLRAVLVEVRRSNLEYGG